jgi:hypothetical protein
MDYPNLTTGQKIKRRFCLSFQGIYEHPNGKLESEEDDKAGVNIYTTDPYMREQLVDSYLENQDSKAKFWQPFFYGAIAMYILLSILGKIK